MKSAISSVCARKIAPARFRLVDAQLSDSCSMLRCFSARSMSSMAISVSLQMAPLTDSSDLAIAHARNAAIASFSVS
jgi:hypothetical protein